MDYTGFNNEVKPARRIVAGEFADDVRLLRGGTADVVAELYRNAEEAGVSVVSWAVTYEPAPGSLYGEYDLTAKATKTRRKGLGLNAVQMEDEIMRLLSQRRED
jgi:hypothetical protein